MAIHLGINGISSLTGSVWYTNTSKEIIVAPGFISENINNFSSQSFQLFGTLPVGLSASLTSYDGYNLAVRISGTPTVTGTSSATLRWSYTPSGGSATFIEQSFSFNIKAPDTGSGSQMVLTLSDGSPGRVGVASSLIADLFLDFSAYSASGNGTYVLENLSITVVTGSLPLGTSFGAFSTVGYYTSSFLRGTPTTRGTYSFDLDVSGTFRRTNGSFQDTSTVRISKSITITDPNDNQNYGPENPNGYGEIVIPEGATLGTVVNPPGGLLTVVIDSPADNYSGSSPIDLLSTIS